MPALYYLDEHAVRAVVEALTVELFPGTLSFRLAGDAGRGRLLAALGQPHWPKYRTLGQKAGVLHYSLNRDHPYVDGNKRLAVVATELFVGANNAVLFATDEALESLALGVADGSISLQTNCDFFTYRVTRLHWSEDQWDRWFNSLPAAHRDDVEAWMQDFTRGARNVIHEHERARN